MNYLPADYVTAAQAWPERWRDEFEERAAILEFDAGLARLAAEKKAFAQVFTLMKGARK